MMAVIASTFRVAQPRRSWASAHGLIILTGACSLLIVVSYIVIAILSADPIEVAGETIWLRP
jgi:hypothetical protein